LDEDDNEHLFPENQNFCLALTGKKKLIFIAQSLKR
jgi:hypothetical protein